VNEIFQGGSDTTFKFRCLGALGKAQFKETYASFLQVSRCCSSIQLTQSRSAQVAAAFVCHCMIILGFDSIFMNWKERHVRLKGTNVALRLQSSRSFSPGST
jgi:hypothetical protein